MPPPAPVKPSKPPIANPSSINAHIALSFIHKNDSIKVELFVESRHKLI